MGKSYYSYRVRAALAQTMALAHAANKYVNDTAPWKLRKTDLARCGTVLNVASRAIINVAILLYPVIPDTALKVLTKAGLVPDGKVPEFKPYSGDLNNMALGADDTLLFAKIMDDQIKFEVEKLKASSKPLAQP